MEESLELLRSVRGDAEALADIAYIHRQRGEMDLAERRYREALSLNPKLKPAIRALAELSKTPMQLDLADDTSTLAAADADLMTNANEIASPKSAIQQVSGTESASGRVITADFVEDSPQTGKPELLDDTPEFMKQVATPADTAPTVDETDPFADIEPPVTPESTNPLPPANNDDWSK